jgi:hypothetical protein
MLRVIINGTIASKAANEAEIEIRIAANLVFEAEIATIEREASPNRASGEDTG